jgi:hypothetical protein
VTPQDFELIPDILAAPDTVAASGKTRQGLDAIIYQKQMDGTVYYVEEARTGQHELATMTMYKRKAP